MKIGILIVFLALSLVGSSQCAITSIPFKGGEKLDYIIYYNYKKLWVPAGKVRFEVNDSIYNGKDCFHFNGRGKTFKEYDWFFKVRDQYQSFATKKELKPERFIRNVHEGSTSIYYDYTFNHSKNEAYYKRSKSDQTSDTITNTHCVFDVMTTVYYARTIDFTKYKVNDTVPLTMILDGKKYETYIRYTGKGTTKTRSGEVYKVVKFKPLLIEGTIFTGGEDMEVSVSDDKNRVPLLVEAKILVGSVKVYIDKMKGLKYPMTSKVVTPKK
ncbi:MAG: DUF3108 domain-containing protein [Flavobacteriales bacterium]|nr:DUF3108 domain-containing protein [Flavobacteriales bacterium]